MEPRWRKSSYSFSNGNCVEIAPGILVRDSQDPDGPQLGITAAAWREFTRCLKAGDDA